MDFSKLTDDQLVELVRSLCFEAAQRGWAVQQAAQAAMLSEAEKARIAVEAAVREAERLREAEARRIADEAAAKVRREVEAARSQAEAAERHRKEQRRAALAEAVFAVLGKHGTISYWSPRDKPGTDRRMYFDQGDGYVRNGWKICVHLDGSSKVRPGTVEGAVGIKADALRGIAEIAAAWRPDRVQTKVYCDRDDLERGGDHAAQYQAILDAYRVAAAEEERQAEAARLEKERAEAAQHAAYAERVATELAPLREVAGRHGCTAVRLMACNLGGNHITISLDPQRVMLRYQNYLIKTEHEPAPEHAPLAAAALEALQPLKGILHRISSDQPPTITLTPLEVAHA